MSVVRARDHREVETSTVFALHPLVVVNISDHHTRRKLATPASATTAGAPAKRVVGMLLGQVQSRRIEIHSGFEVIFDDVPEQNGVNINFDFLRSKRESTLRVYPEYDIVGWYTTGDALSPHDLDVTHQALVASGAVSETQSVILVLDTAPPAGSITLPVFLFEARVKTSGTAPAVTTTTSVDRVSFAVVSEESERIGVEAAMQADDASEAIPSLKGQTDRLSSALVMLRVRISVVVRYLEAVDKGEIAKDYDMLRRIACLANQMPRSGHPGFTKAFQEEFDDNLLMAYLGLVSKGSIMLNRLASDVSECGQGGRGGFGKRGLPPIGMF